MLRHRKKINFKHKMKKAAPNLSVIDADRQLFRGEAAKNEAVWGTDPCTGQHGEHGLWHHGHVDDNKVSFLYPILHQDSC